MIIRLNTVYYFTKKAKCCIYNIPSDSFFFFFKAFSFWQSLRQCRTWIYKLKEQLLYMQGHWLKSQHIKKSRIKKKINKGLEEKFKSGGKKQILKGPIFISYWFATFLHVSKWTWTLYAGLHTYSVCYNDYSCRVRGAPVQRKRESRIWLRTCLRAAPHHKGGTLRRHFI